MGTITTGNVCGGGVTTPALPFFPPVKILTVLCKKSVFCPLLPASGRLLDEEEVDDDIEWQRTTRGAPPPPDQSPPPPPLLLLLLLDEPSRPAELDRYGGGDSDSSTVRFGGGRMHFWWISDS